MKDYLSVDYICQEIRGSIMKYLSDKTGGEFPNSYHFNPTKNKGIINFKIHGLETTLIITKNPKKQEYSLTELIEKNGKELIKSDMTIKPKRTSNHRISGKYLKEFTEERISNLKQYLAKQ